MSYTYSKAFVRANRDSVDWIATDLSQQQLHVIISSYADVSIELSNPFESGPVYLDRDLLVAAMPPKIPSPTLTAWLAALGSQALTTRPTPPAQLISAVGFTDAAQGGYIVQRADMTRSPDTQIPNSAKPDLLLTKAGVDLYAMAPYLMVSVNGFFHPVSGSINGLYVKQGGVSGALANNNHVGVLSFAKVGKLQQIPITADMVYKPDPALAYNQSAYINLPVSLAGKTLLMVIGGYLHVLDEAYTVVGDNTVKLNTRALSLPQRIYQSMRAIDLSGLPLDRRADKNDSQVSVASLTSDATVLAYLTLPQTFAIVVDAPRFYRRTHQLERPKHPGRFFNLQGYRFPLFGARGRLYEYRLSVEDGVYVYGTEPMFNDNYLFETTDYTNMLSISDSRTGWARVDPTQPVLLEFGTYN